MKKWIGTGLFLVGLYFAAVLIRANLSESNAEKHMKIIINDISNPWQAEKIRFHGSQWLNNMSRLTPEEIAKLAANDLGHLRSIKEGPDCIFQSGYRPDNPDEEIVWAMCEVVAHFDKSTVRLKIRLIDEGSNKQKLFLLLGHTLKLNDIADIEIVKNGDN